MTKTYTCTTCGKNYGKEVASLNGDAFVPGNCHSCSFWLRKIDLSDDKSVIVNGSHFRIGSYCPRKGNGMGGDFFAIEFNDGLIIGTRDLWSQGVIDQPFVDRLPNNAKFIYKLGKVSTELLEQGWHIMHYSDGEYRCFAPGDDYASKIFKDGVWTA